MGQERLIAAAIRLAAAEKQMQEAIQGLDGSPASRMRFARAKEEYRLADLEALLVARAGAPSVWARA